MSNTWKWIVGIIVALFIIAVVVAGVFVWRNQAMMAYSFRRPPVSQGPSVANPNSGQATPAPNGSNGQTQPYGFDGGRNRKDGRGWAGPMMGGRSPMMGGGGFSHFGGFMPFGIGFFILAGLLRLIIPLGVLALVAWLFYRMGKSAGVAAASAAPTSPPAQPVDAPTGRKVAKS